MQANSYGDLRIGLVGLGYWGPNRLRVLTELADVETAWICDQDADRLARFAQRHPAVTATTDVEDVLGDPELDAVIFATPADTHAELTAAALDADKHVFVEKPLARTSGDAERLVEAADRRGLRLMCGHTFLYSPSVRLVNELLEREELGELHYISSSRVNLGPYRSDVSVISDLGPHDFSILLHWLGSSPEQVSAVGLDVISPGIQDVAFVHAAFSSGLIANVELSWLAPSKLRRTVLVGSEKMVVYEDGSAEPVRLYDSGIEYRDPETYGEYHHRLPDGRHRVAARGHGRADRGGAARLHLVASRRIEAAEHSRVCPSDRADGGGGRDVARNEWGARASRSRSAVLNPTQSAERSEPTFWARAQPGFRFTERPVGTPAFFREIEQHRYTLEPHIPEIVQFGRWRNHDVLEVGCGIATDGLQFARAGARYTGLDSSPRAIDLARRRFAIEDRRAEFVEASATGLPFGDRTFDLVYANGVLHHIPDVERAVEEIHRVLRPGGHVVAMVYHRRSFNYL